jgi:uncharacterized protein YjiS (DUF1127 family)
MRTLTSGDNSGAAGARTASIAATCVTDAVTIASGIPLARLSLRSMFAWYRERLANQRVRRELARLTDQQLEDIGLSRMARDREVRRSFWD